MKIFEILDEENSLSIGVLLYYEKSHTYIIELSETLDEWSAPLLFTRFIREKSYTIPRDVSLMWVKERVIPSGRQNLGSILSNHRLKDYDEMKFLELSQGRCSQDSLYIRKIEVLPDYALKRAEKNLLECVPLEGTDILCFFADGITKKIDLKKLKKHDDIQKVISNRVLFQSCTLGVGGYYITFNDSIDIGRDFLYDAGATIPISLSDLSLFVQKNVLDTTRACETLECSRQNLAYLVKQDQLTPLQENLKGNIFLKGDILRNSW